MFELLDNVFFVVFREECKGSKLDATLISNYSQCHVRVLSLRVTPQKFKMEPEKKFVEKEIPFGNHHFQVDCSEICCSQHP